MKKWTVLIALFTVAVFMFLACSNPKTETPATASKTDTLATAPAKQIFGGFESQVQWGASLVKIAGCNDCHTPKKWDQKGQKMT
jgi:hypothetical protein